MGQPPLDLVYLLVAGPVQKVQKNRTRDMRKINHFQAENKSWGGFRPAWRAKILSGKRLSGPITIDKHRELWGDFDFRRGVLHLSTNHRT
jgi:hypothetical protein